ncbi:hypothetical protein LJB88_04570 [Erysipelotrichaceae bacterium OttesenSCG-928-M19]|nr:hypothetical protein [Erysipelotrichaceae bacterium OttesenSCG-928-M19]
MKVRFLKPTNVDIGNGLKVYQQSENIVEIKDDFAKENKLKERFKKFPDAIEIIKESKNESNSKKGTTKEDK